MMRVHDVGVRQDPRQAWRDGVRRMPAQPAEDGQRAMPQSTGLAVHTRAATEGDELALDLAGEGPRQLERITLATTE